MQKKIWNLHLLYCSYMYTQGLKFSIRGGGHFAFILGKIFCTRGTKITKKCEFWCKNWITWSRHKNWFLIGLIWNEQKAAQNKFTILVSTKEEILMSNSEIFAYNNWPIQWKILGSPIYSPTEWYVSPGHIHPFDGPVISLYHSWWW